MKWEELLGGSMLGLQDSMKAESIMSAVGRSLEKVLSSCPQGQGLSQEFEACINIVAASL